MIPLSDSIPSQTKPYVNYVVIAICSLAFLAQIGTGRFGAQMAERFGMVPLRISDPETPPMLRRQDEMPTVHGGQVKVVEYSLADSPIPGWAAMLTCLFLHGGWTHFLGNMWFLYIFGDNVEDRLGHVGYALMYLGTGVFAGFAHFLSGPESSVPTIGASGAIAGVMGAYAFFYPKARVLAILPIPILLRTFVLPAPVFLGIWFALQTVSGLTTSAGSGGVAWWAHIGGFVAGAAVALVIGRSPVGSAAVSEQLF